MSLKAIEAWQCNDCGAVYECEDEAHECCMPIIIEGFKCPVCFGFHLSESNALTCCPVDEDGHPMAKPWELEAAGQMRLIG